MPSMIIHKIIAKELSKTYEVDEVLFTIGNIIPDSWRNVKNGSRKLSHFQTDNTNKENYNLFYKKYKNQLNNPIYLGYLTHLITDSYWKNNIFKSDLDNKANEMRIRHKIKNIEKTLTEEYNLKRICIEKNISVDIEELTPDGNLDLSDTISFANQEIKTNKETQDISMQNLKNEIDKNCNYIKKIINELEKSV